jgi:tagatose 6-phosphate kinase
MILVVGLSSVWQRTLFFQGFQPGEVNRATRVVETASGKGVNVARVATQLGAKARVLTTAGGTRGEWFQGALKADGVPATVVTVGGDTRICQTLIGLADHSPLITEIVEETPALTPNEVDAVFSAYARALRQASMVVLSGTVPKGCGDDFYAELARQAKRREIPVLVDTQRAQLIQVAREQPSLVKINRTELAAATGKRTVASGVRELLKLGAKRVIISQGAKASLAFDGKATWQVVPPSIQVVNPIGSGDAMMAGIAVALSQGKPLLAALKLGIACGAANALTETSGVIRKHDVRRLQPH